MDAEAEVEAFTGDDEELSPEMQEVLSHKATAIVSGPSQVPEELQELRKESLKKGRKKALEADEEAELSKKIGTDEQEIPFDPGRVVGSRGPVAAAGEADKSLLIQLVPGGHPVLTFEGAGWGPRDVKIVLGSIMRGWRLYQRDVQRSE
jgi:hypothetical protein